MHKENIFDLFNAQQAELAKAAQPADVVTPAQAYNEKDIVRPEDLQPAVQPAQPAQQAAAPAEPAADPAEPAEPAEEGGEGNV